MAKKQSLEKKKMIRAQSLQKKEDRAKEEAAILNRCLGLLGVLVVAEIYFLMCYRFFVQGTMPVSYTHLDVYKRQIQRGGKLEPLPGPDHCFQAHETMFILGDNRDMKKFLRLS